MVAQQLYTLWVGGSNPSSPTILIPEELLQLVPGRVFTRVGLRLRLPFAPGELEVLGDGKQCKPYLLVDELVNAMIFISEKAGERLNFYNIGPVGEGMTVRGIAEEVVRVASPGASIRYTGGEKGWVGDVPQFNYSIRKLQNLGWMPEYSSEQAVKTAVQALWDELKCRP